MSILGFITGSLIPHIVSTPTISTVGSYVAHTLTPFVMAHPAVGVPIAIAGGAAGAGVAGGAATLIRYGIRALH